MFLGKWEDSDFEGQAYYADQMTEHTLGELSSKSFPQKKNCRKGLKRIIQKMDRKILLAH